VKNEGRCRYLVRDKRADRVMNKRGKMLQNLHKEEMLNDK
jgi:hypothetical protein